MSDLENQLRSLELPQPPPQWGEEILARCEFTEPAAHGWHAWLWPSPLAWAALAIIWLGLAGSHLLDRPALDRSPHVATRPTAFPLYSQQQPRNEADPFWPLASNHRQ